MLMQPSKVAAQSFYPNKSGKKPSWLIIISAFILFFPVGIYLLHKRLKVTKGLGSAATVTYAWSIVGAVLTILVIIGGGGVLSWITLAVFVIAFFCAVGEGVQWKDYDTYIAILMSGEWYLPYIAETIGKKQEEVITDLKDMFSEGIFAGSYIDMAALTVETDYSCLAKMGMYPPELKAIYVNEENYPQASYKKTVVRCKGCGANVEGNVGQTAICEFCDAPISF